MKRSHAVFVAVSLFFCFAALGKTDVRALVSRPTEVSKRGERKCKVDSDCALIQCHAYCNFDGVANKRYVKKVGARCNAQKKAEGDDTIVDCAISKTQQAAKCTRGYCTIEETWIGEPLIEPPRPQAPKN